MEEIQTQIDDINDRLDENDSSLQDFSDNLDSSLSDIQSTLDDNASTLDELQTNEGQLTFPLSQDTIDLITEQAPAIIRSWTSQGNAGSFTMVAGAYTLLNPNITVNSVIVFSMTSPANITLTTLGAVYVYHWVVCTAGQAVFHSSQAGETSTFNYFIAQY